MTSADARRKYYQNRKARLTDEQRERERLRNRENARRWRLENMEHVREYQRHWRAENPEKVRAIQERFYEKRAKDV